MRCSKSKLCITTANIRASIIICDVQNYKLIGLVPINDELNISWPNNLRNTQESGCVVFQVVFRFCHGVLFFKMVFKTINSLCMQATRMTLAGLPFAFRRLANSAMAGLYRWAERAAM